MLDCGPSETLWTASGIARAAGGIAATDFPVSGIAIDSRDLVPGDLFIALSGARDGHDFIDAAFGNGASGVLTGKDYRGPADAGRTIRVNDTFEALMALGRAARDRFSGPVIAVTGSAGKTTVTQGLRAALGRNRPAHSSIRSFNNHIGVPLSLARMPADAAYGIFELGMNAPGEIRALSALSRPDLAIITTVAPAHLEAFENMDAVADAKAEIFEGVSPGGKAVLNRGIPHYARLLERARAAGIKDILTFGFSKDADVRPLKLAEGEACSCVTADVAGRILTFKTAGPGRTAIENALAILAAVAGVGGDLGLAGLSLAEMRPLPGRGARYALDINGARITLIDDSYNANPLSVSSALAMLGRMKPGMRGRRVAVLGDMAELGAFSESCHASLAGAVRDNADLLIAAGPMMSALSRAVGGSVENVHLASPSAALTFLEENLEPGDVILVKGSRAAGMDEIVSGLMRRGTLTMDAAG